jgi:SNARE protein
MSEKQAVDMSGSSKAQVLARGQELVDRTGEALDRTRRLALQTEVKASSIDQALVAQSEQLQRVNREFDDIDSNITRSKKIMGQLVRSYAQDKCIQVLCGVITVCVLVMVVLAVTSASGQSSSGNYVKSSK